MRVLHIVKTSTGATWAAREAAELTRLGADVHVALPDATGSCVRLWEEARATIHIAAFDFPVRDAWRVPAVCRSARVLVNAVKPDLIHTHHVGPTLIMRLALGKQHITPRIFQVPGPLHLEHWLYRTWETSSAGPRDYWIASSRAIQNHYRSAGVRESRLFLSYYGIRTGGFSQRRTNGLRRRLGISPRAFVAGNISYIYGPKYYLGQAAGVKRHEDLIAALGIVLRQRADAVGVLVGGAWEGAEGYRQKLVRMAQRAGKGRILMPGALTSAEVRDWWPDFDCAMHVPQSENCGGVVEPLLAGIPVIAANVGGLPEVVMDGLTGTLVPARNPAELAAALLKVRDDPQRFRKMAALGGRLAAEMFDVRRTACEVHQAYRHILDHAEPRPGEFNARAWIGKGRMECMQA